MAGPTLNGESFGSWHRATPRADEARIAVGELASQGVDFIKIHRATTRDGFYAIMKEARRRQLDVVGHVPLVMGFVEASNAGLRTVEHVQTLLENELSAGSAPATSIDEAINRLQGTGGDVIFAALARNGTYFCPTLVGYEATWVGNPPEREQAKRRLYARMSALVTKAQTAGVPILAGTDVLSDQGNQLLLELERMVAIRMTPRAAIAAATTTPRRLTGRGPGSLAVGEIASFLLVDADPLADIHNLRRLDAVVKNGVIINSEQLARWRAMAN